MQCVQQVRAMGEGDTKVLTASIEDLSNDLGVVTISEKGKIQSVNHVMLRVSNMYIADKMLMQFHHWLLHFRCLGTRKQNLLGRTYP